MKRTEKSPTRLILIRHLDTKARQVRGELKKDSLNSELIDLLNKPTLDPSDMAKIQEDGKILLERYGYLTDDPILDILPEEVPVGKQIGKALIKRFGMPDRWEVSTFLRARRSSTALRQGIEEVSAIPLPKETFSQLARERDFGKASEYPSTRVYLATHVEELQKHRRDPEGYTYQGGESRRGFQRRQKIKVFLEKWLPRYEGKTTVLVTHSMVIEEHLRRHVGFTDGNDDIWTGTVTVLEAEPKKFLRPRRYHLVGPVGQQIV